MVGELPADAQNMGSGQAASRRPRRDHLPPILAEAGFTDIDVEVTAFTSPTRWPQARVLRQPRGNKSLPP
jgi:hypothetical protein